MESVDAVKLQKYILGAIECLSDSLTLVQEKCVESEFNTYRRHVADIVARIQHLLLNPLYEDHPDLDDLR
jgi:hypothetical protein